jgi:hypothetical protein
MRIARSSEIVPPYTPEAPSAEGSGPGPAVPSSSSFSKLMRGLGHELDRGEALTARAIRGGGAGGGLSPGELLALQAGIYRYVEAVDLVTKLVDRATQAVKTTLQNQ